jgi:hypothetical protein
VLYAVPTTTLGSGDDVFHVGTGADSTDIEKVLSDVSPVGPVARTVTDAEPEAVGVPDIVPEEDTEIQESPLTLEYDEVYDADTLVEYDTDCCAEGSVVPVIQDGDG